MVERRIMFRYIAILLFGVHIWTSILCASPATEASSALKGYFGESLVEDIYKAAGRELIPYKIDPNISGPDKIFKLADGVIEVHEVKAYSAWAGKGALDTTANAMPTKELSARWCQNWIDKTLSSATASETEKNAAKMLSEAINQHKARFIFDEINLSTEQFRCSEILQEGLDGVTLSEKMGPVRIDKFNDILLQKTKDFKDKELWKLGEFMENPKVSSSSPLSREDQVALLKKNFSEQNVEKIEAHQALMTADGRLLISVKAGFQAGLMVFAAEAVPAIYHYAQGDILKPELQRKLTDASIKGTFVGTCVGITVFLGATPAGWCVLAVSAGAYFVIDQTIKCWHEHQDRKYLSIDDLRAWGITLDTTLEPEHDTILDPRKDTIIDPKIDTILF